MLIKNVNIPINGITKPIPYQCIPYPPYGLIKSAFIIETRINCRPAGIKNFMQNPQ